MTSVDLIRRAEGLTGIAGIFSVSSFIPHLDRYPILREADPARWDFIVSSACVFLAVTRLHQLGLPTATEERVLDVVTERVAGWNPDGLRAVEACRSMFDREGDRLTSVGHPQKFVAADALGIWVFWNLFDRAPSSQPEAELVRTIGSGVVHEFIGYWS